MLTHLNRISQSPPLDLRYSESPELKGKFSVVKEGVGPISASSLGAFFPKIGGKPQMDGLWWKTLLKWMIWGTPIFGNTHFLVGALVTPEN